jgi:hypothetical protein
MLIPHYYRSTLRHRILPALLCHPVKQRIPILVFWVLLAMHACIHAGVSMQVCASQAGGSAARVAACPVVEFYLKHFHQATHTAAFFTRELISSY